MTVKMKAKNRRSVRVRFIYTMYIQLKKERITGHGRKGKGGQLLFKGMGHTLKDGLGVDFVPECIQAYVVKFS